MLQSHRNAWSTPLFRNVRALTLAAAPLLTSCSSPPPDDGVLMERFRANQEVFERLARQPDDTSLHARLGIVADQS